MRILGIILLHLSSFGNVLSQEDHDYNEQLFLQLSKTVYMINEIHNPLFSYDYKGKKTLFIEKRNEFFNDPDYPISIHLDNKVVNF